MSQAPQQPRAILRGHKAQVHAAAFIRGNGRLVTGDADGFIAAWDLTTMRPRAVWRAHENAILGVAGWGRDKLITHGRDNKLIVWKLREEDESSLSTDLPLDASPDTRPQPWVLHLLEVNTMNFCTFSLLPLSASEALIAVPNTLASEAIDIFRLPSQSREHTVRLGDKNGMVMALALVSIEGRLTIVAGYENGVAIVAQLDDEASSWTTVYRAKTHTQPILSLDVTPEKDYCLTSSADAVIGKHPLPSPLPMEPDHRASQGNPTSSPDPAPSTAIKGASVVIGRSPPTVNAGGGTSLLTAALAAPPQASTSITHASRDGKGTQRRHVATEPLKAINTRHAGQQGLRIRSDGRIFATAGWDARVRVYSAKTMKELAVLKWHQAGCYAVAFSDVETDGVKAVPPGEADISSGDDGHGEGAGDGSAGKGAGAGLVPRVVDVTVKEKRVGQAKSAHWLAAGSKDGKVSLWEVY